MTIANRDDLDCPQADFFALPDADFAALWPDKSGEAGMLDGSVYLPQSNFIAHYRVATWGEARVLAVRDAMMGDQCPVS